MAPGILSFASANSETAATSAAPTPGPLSSVEATGSNGTLTIDEVQIIVDEFKLEGDDAGCQEMPAEAEGCGRFEARPYVLDLPLDAVPIDIATSAVPAGTYFLLKLETTDLASSSAKMEAIGDEVLAAFPDWPENASLRVAGSFDPGDGSDPVVAVSAQ